MGKNQQVIGIVILAAGLFILLGKWGVFAFIGGNLWPLIMFLVGRGVRPRPGENCTACYDGACRHADRLRRAVHADALD